MHVKEKMDMLKAPIPQKRQGAARATGIGVRLGNGINDPIRTTTGATTTSTTATVTPTTVTPTTVTTTSDADVGKMITMIGGISKFLDRVLL